jgi:hypothetical protein
MEDFKVLQINSGITEIGKWVANQGISYINVHNHFG